MKGGEPSGTVVLLTDFGPSHYAGILKGVISGIAPETRLIDLTHTVTPHAVREGAWILLTSYKYFPRGTVFLAVVDPGVGSERQALALMTKNYYFVGPDNGLLYPAASEDGILHVRILQRQASCSLTFEGRDLFAPAAARISRGEALPSLGVPGRPGVQLGFYLESRTGEVVLIDPFGNLITNIPPIPGKRAYRLAYAGHALTVPYCLTYAEGRAGHLIVTTGSAGTLELAIPNGRASERIELLPGDRLELA
ncbi:MAG: SAM hydrolase/SAM-dependent halogenase family protein [Bacillota bacterium]